MNEWIQFFFGTPRRFCWTVAVLGLLTVLIFPGLLATAVSRLVAELSPLLGPVLAVLIVVGGLRMIFRGRGR